MTFACLLKQTGRFLVAIYVTNYFDALLDIKVQSEHQAQAKLWPGSMAPRYCKA